MNGPMLSRYSPGQMAGDLLERLFVAREQTLEAIVARIGAAASSRQRNHTLLVGPRGAGKTHLIALAHHRALRLRQEGAKISLAWLPEDPWTLVSYRHLLAAIVDRLDPPIEGVVPTDAPSLEHLLKQRAGELGPIVVFAENLDTILASLGDEGQQKLRHLLQTDRSLLFVASTTRLDRTLTDESSPFYEFFTTTRLEPFGVDEAAAMLERVALERDDQEMADYVQSDEGRSRLAIVLHLAGGQPRMWATLAGAINVDGLRELVDLLLTKFDDLTPYYQEQLARLSPQQRLIVAELAEADHPLNVKTLAERLGLDQRSVGKTMAELADRAWVSPTSSMLAQGLDRRRTYYELAEPLARLSFQIKASRGEPLRLIIDILKLWFNPADLERLSKAEPPDPYLVSTVAGYGQDSVLAVTRQLRRLPSGRAPTVALLGSIEEALAAFERGDPEPLLQLPTSIRMALEDQLEDAADTFDLQREVHWMAQREFGFVRHPAMEVWIALAEELVSVQVDPRRVALGQLEIADWSGRAWLFEDAHLMLQTAHTTLGSDDETLLTTRGNLATAYRNAGRVADAVDLHEQVLADSERILGPNHPDTLSSRSDLALAYLDAGRIRDAIDLTEQVLDDYEGTLGADHADSLTTRHNLAFAYAEAGRIDDAINLNEQVLAESERSFGADHPDTLVARTNLAVAYTEAGRTNEAISLTEQVLADSERILGPHHPTTLITGSNLALAYTAAGRIDDAIKLNEQVLADCERTFGADHPSTLTTRSNLAHDYSAAGHTDVAITLFERIHADRERILGRDHRDTIATHEALEQLRSALE
jgi:tetratricopeptide (TPR) repeat protein